MQLSLREQAGQIRGSKGAAVRASWTSYAVGPFLLSMGVAAFLGFVGAFGSGAAPFWPRIGFFLFIGLGCAVMVVAVVWASHAIAWLRPRPTVRRIAIALALTPLTAVWVWAAVGFAFLGGPHLPMLPTYLGYSLGMSVVMTALSWAIFGRRSGAPEAPPEARARFLERLPFRLQGGELYAVEAEDHYLRARTSKGSELILMRFSDALPELEGIEGAQTHRSWWVAKAGIADLRRSDGRAVLVLKDGAEAPVSRTHARTLRSLGWL